MITTSTVFILGAGASMPYGYPSGLGLVQKMDSLHSETVSVLKSLGFGPTDWGPFQRELKRSAHSSIDAFLERREDFREIGKALIASEIIRCETEGLLVSDDSWYSLLVDKVDGPFDEIGKNPVAFVTFNYDRSLEHFLIESLCSRHNKECENVAEQLKTLPLIHVYGHVGHLPWQDANGRKYSPKISADIVRKAAEDVRIISEGRDDSVELQHARKLISEARRVFFLGFGFHRDNMRRLGFPLTPDHTQRIVASGFNLKEAEGQHYLETYNLNRVGHFNDRNVAFLRNSREFLALAE